MRKSSGVSEGLFIIIVLLIAAAIALIVLSITPAHAADTVPTVCRDIDYPAGIRYEFRNIPENWIDVTGYWYVADDGGMTQSNYGNVFVADALTKYDPDASGIKVGEAVFGTSDNTFILRGNADTLPCNMPVPVATPVSTPCPAWAIDSNTGELICLWSLPKATS